MSYLNINFSYSVSKSSGVVRIAFRNNRECTCSDLVRVGLVSEESGGRAQRAGDPSGAQRYSRLCYVPRARVHADAGSPDSRVLRLDTAFLQI